MNSKPVFSPVSLCIHPSIHPSISPYFIPSSLCPPSFRPFVSPSLHFIVKFTSWRKTYCSTGERAMGDSSAEFNTSYLLLSLLFQLCWLIWFRKLLQVHSFTVSIYFRCNSAFVCVLNGIHSKLIDKKWINQ